MMTSEEKVGVGLALLAIFVAAMAGSALVSWLVSG